MSGSEYWREQQWRMAVIRSIREFFDERGFSECLCPVLLPSVPAEPTIYPFSTRWGKRVGQEWTARSLYLPVSPERSMKHFLAAGAGSCYTVGHCFRNLEGTSPTHHPEFLMLEWYRVDRDYRAIMADTRALLCFLAQRLTGATRVRTRGGYFELADWQTISIAELWRERLGVELEAVMDESALRALAQARGCEVAGADWEQLFNQLFLNEIESQLPRTPFFLIDFPARLSPLCRPRADRPWLAERFEAYVDGVELGNGNSEQLDAAAVGRAFAAELQARRARGEPTQPLDQEMLADIAALQASGHEYAGMGLGVDRVAMLLGDIASMATWWPRLDD